VPKTSAVVTATQLKAWFQSPDGDSLVFYSAAAEAISETFSDADKAGFSPLTGIHWFSTVELPGSAGRLAAWRAKRFSPLTGIHWFSTEKADSRRKATAPAVSVP
jgi:hypothetical protein